MDGCFVSCSLLRAFVKEIYGLCLMGIYNKYMPKSLCISKYNNG
jgi:hypothetical protein